MSKFSLEILLAVLLALIPFGADQMGIHSFWFGLTCWVVASVLLLHLVFWRIKWATSRTRLERWLLATIALAVLTAIAYQPIISAYQKLLITNETETKPRPAHTLPALTSPARASLTATVSKGTQQRTRRPRAGTGSELPKPPSQLAGNVTANGDVTQGGSGNCQANAVGGNASVENSCNSGPPPLKLTFSAHSVSSGYTELPFEEYVLVQPNTFWSPVAFEIFCDHEIKKVVLTGRMFIEPFEAINPTDPKVGFARFVVPPLSAGDAVAVLIFSDQQFSVVKVEPWNSHP